MVTDRDLERLADPRFGQHFLVSPHKLGELFRAANIRPSDRVLEVGAGVGTIARHVPPCKKLTVVEMDTRLIGFLRENVPHAEVIQGDALQLMRMIPFDVLIGSLPHATTDVLLRSLSEQQFRTAVLAVGESAKLSWLAAEFSMLEVTTLTGRDFSPPQASVSRLVRVERHAPAGA